MIALLGNASSLNALSKLGKKAGINKDAESTGTASTIKVKPGQKLSSVGRSLSDSMVDHTKVETRKIETNARPEFHIPKMKKGKSKHFNMTSKHVDDLAKQSDSSS